MTKRSVIVVSPEVILPSPKEVRSTQRVAGRREKAAVITESPCRTRLIERHRTKGISQRVQKENYKQYDRENKKVKQLSSN